MIKGLEHGIVSIFLDFIVATMKSSFVYSVYRKDPKTLVVFWVEDIYQDSLKTILNMSENW